MNTNTSSERRRRELRWVVGTLSGVMALGAVAMIASKEMKQGNIVGAGTSRVGSAATEGSMAEVSVAPAGGAVQQLEVEMDDAGRTLLYAAHLDDFIGGYTVAGHAVAHGLGGAVNWTSFTVAQECICEARATPTGIFATGANDGNAFLLVASLESDGLWYGQQTSFGADEPYTATMRFGATPGGKHTAVGYYINPATDEQKTFRAVQSAIGCNEGSGAGACADVCGAKGLPSALVKAKCGESSDGGQSA